VTSGIVWYCYENASFRPSPWAEPTSHVPTEGIKFLVLAKAARGARPDSRDDARPKGAVHGQTLDLTLLSQGNIILPCCDIDSRLDATETLCLYPIKTTHKQGRTLSIIRFQSHQKVTWSDKPCRSRRPAIEKKKKVVLPHLPLRRPENARPVL
jgi:hypothetical protein